MITYVYDARGNLAKIKEGNNVTATYTYDLADRLIKVEMGDVTVEYTYDKIDRNPKAVYTIGNTSYAVENTYGDNNVLELSDITYGTDEISVDYAYDGIDRLKSMNLKVNGTVINDTDIAFKTVSGKQSSMLVESYVNKKNTDDNAAVVSSYYYTYDNNGNITGIYADSAHNQLISEYQYDKLNRLTYQEDNKGYTTYTYDNGSNITGVSRTYYSSSYGTDYSKSFSYTDSTWKDLLKNYNGQNITYDNIGNPLTYRDGKTLTWTGRQLNTHTASGKVTSYTYNAEGIRTSKTHNGTTTTYEVVGSTILSQTTGTNTLVFLYDGNGDLVGFRKGTASYYYLKNLQGDIVQIIDSTGAVVVTYEYDAWGKILSISGSLKDTIGKENPFRYRGYYYDDESGFYYLNSRYYDPEVCRFINADKEISGSGEDIRGYNLYSYCFNNPVNMSDPNGNWPTWVKKAVAVATAAVAMVAMVVATVVTFGAGSLAGVAAITAAATVTAKTAEVAVLQFKKSKNEGGSNEYVARNVIESIYDNGGKIIGSTPFIKTAGLSFNHILNVQVSSIFKETVKLRDTFSMTGGKVVAYGFAAYAWLNTTISVFCENPAERATVRRYDLR